MTIAESVRLSILELYSQGRSIREIAAETGVGKNTVSRAIKASEGTPKNGDTVPKIAPHACARSRIPTVPKNGDKMGTENGDTPEPVVTVMEVRTITRDLTISELFDLLQSAKEDLEIARRYNAAFAEIDGIRTPFLSPSAYHAYHLYVIQVADRAGLYNYLREHQIYAQVHYVPLHLMPYYSAFGYRKGDFPVVEEYYDHCLSLPMFPTLSEEEQQYVIDTVLEFVS